MDSLILVQCSYTEVVISKAETEVLVSGMRSFHTHNFYPAFLLRREKENQATASDNAATIGWCALL